MVSFTVGTVGVVIWNGLATLRFDGVYICEKSGIAYCHRFYEDGVVVSVGTTISADRDYANYKWISRGNKSLATGTFSLRRGKLEYSTKSEYGVVDHKAMFSAGDFQGSHLSVQSHSHINGHKGNKSFVFMKHKSSVDVRARSFWLW